MRGEFTIAEATEIHDLPEAGVGSRIRHVLCRGAVLLGEVVAAHRMDEVVRGGGTFEGRGDRRWLVEISLDYFHPIPPRMLSEGLGPTGHGADVVALVEKCGDDAATDVPAGTEHGDEFVRHIPLLRSWIGYGMTRPRSGRVSREHLAGHPCGPITREMSGTPGR